VSKQLDGLQEKFRVLNKDDLADALYIRLDELDRQRVPWAPEILSLLLQLSDRPATVSKTPTFELLTQQSPPRLTWSDLDASGSAYVQEDIWHDIDFAAETSSDDDYSSISSGVSIPKILPQSFKPSQDEFVVPEELFSSGEDEDLLATIKSGHFWKYDSTAIRESSESHTRFITELQASREILFMLQGLPTSLFWHLDDSIEVDRRYALRHSSNTAFLHILRSCASIGAKVGDLRRFAKIPQSVIFLQTFVRGVEEYLQAFDLSLCRLQLQYLSPGQAVTASLLRLMEDVKEEARVPLLLADLVEQLKTGSPDQSFISLDLLYDLVCMNQAAGNDRDFKCLAKLFFSCFEAYIRPIRLWMETGQLDTSQGTFFISDTRHANDLRTLWHDWYTLDETSGRLNAPKFLKPAVHKVFTTGKSMIFLRNLSIATERLDSFQRTTLALEDVCPDDESLLLIPFSGLLDAAFEKLIDTNHRLASNLLREQLDEQCGLWTSLSALGYIYLCRDITICASIDSKIFELIDRGRAVWNDRFLLTELVQSTFSDVPSVDSSRLIVRSSRGPYRDADNRSRTVKILKSLSIDYVLPWPVANIITKNAVLTYQRISTFLMQIRRAKYILERQRLRKGGPADPEFDGEDDHIGYGVRHGLLWFTNILYSHLTELVIAMATLSMERSLAASKDVDGMIAAHQSYMSSLEEQCMLSKNLAPIYQAVISILDLCVHFADIQAARHGENQFDQTTRSFGSSSGRRHRDRTSGSRYHKRRNRRRSFSDDEDYDDDDERNEDDDDFASDEDEGNTTSISFLESPYSHRLRHVREQFERLLAFIVAGLRGVGRVDGEQPSWEMLAERLEWRKRVSTQF
jgi:gamma-tubulin complex component 5